MKNVNADFLLDIWADLKEKRLAPVAIGLVVAVVAMPALMLNGGGDAPAEGPLPIIAPAASDGAEVEVASELAEGESELDSYKARDPFDGLVKPQADDAPGSGAAIAPGDLIGKGGGGEGAELPSLGGGDGSAPSDGLTGDSGSGGLDTVGGGKPPVVVKKPGAKFTYQLDVKFGRPGREKRYPNLSRMTFLPSADVPALLFMGVPTDEKSALFFVHPTLSHAGEGICTPSKSSCEFLRLAIGREHFLSVDDYEFRIKLLDVKRVKLSTERKQRAKARKAARLHRSNRGEGAVGGNSAASQYHWPILVDGIG